MRTNQARWAIAALIAGAAAAWLAAARTFAPYQTSSAAVGLLVGWSFIGSGLAASRVRSENPLGMVMVLTGFAWFASFLADARSPVVFTAGELVQDLYLVGVGYVVLTFPSGRPQATLERAVIWSAVALLTVGQLVVMLFAQTDRCPLCPPANLLAVAHNQDLANTPPRPIWRSRTSGCEPNYGQGSPSCGLAAGA